MKVLHIAHQNNFGFSVPDFVQAPIPPKTRLEDWARLYHDEWGSADIFIIDAFFSPFDDDYLKPDGIKLLKILRLFGYKQHCIIYSFYSLEEMLFDYQYTSILKSKGTTYLRVPCVVDEALCEAKISVSCEEDMVPFFKAEAMEWMGTKRHSLANWWGVLRVYDLLRLCGLNLDNTSSGIQDVLRRDSSYEGLLMNYVRFQGPKPIFYWEETKANAQREHMRVLWKKDLKVVYIDDQADEGWGDVLQMILYGCERSDLFIAPQLPREGIDLENLAQSIASLKPDLLIVDIRLEHKDEHVRLSELSGIKLIKNAVIDNSVCCPILVFTASDKRRVSEKAIASGADAVWTKEGVDEGAHIPGSDYFAFTYARFQDLVFQLRRLVGYDYSLLYDCRRRINEIECSPNRYWWEESKWYLGDVKEREPLKREQIIKELERLFLSHKQFLTVSQSEIRSSIYDMLTFKLCRMMEVFHPSRIEGGIVISLKRVVNEDWPKFSAASAFANHIVSERNCLFHMQPTSSESESDAYRYRKTLFTFFDYLTLKRPADVSERVVGVLTKVVDKNGQRHIVFSSDMIDGAFKRDEDIEKCESILQSNKEMDNIEVLLDAAPSLCYRIGGTKISTSFQSDWKEYWLASYKILQTGSWGGYISLFDISPRKGVSFRIQKPKDPISLNDKIYFHIRWIDRDRNLYCALTNVTLNPPMGMKHTYWTGIVSRVIEIEGGVYVLLKEVEPPFDVYFFVNPQSIKFLKEGKKTSKICFRPDWIQEWEVKDPVKVEDDIISPCWPNW